MNTNTKVLNSIFVNGRKPLLFLLLIALVGMSCNKTPYIKPSDTLPTAFNKAKKLYSQEKYGEAADAFETVISIGRGSDIAQEAQYLLAESYYKNQEYLIAASEYDRYVSYYPRSEKRRDAEFKAALCYYELSPRYRLDQSHTRKAIEKFQLFISRHPDSEKTQQAGAYIDDLRDKLAHKIVNAADLYLRIDRYEAAAIYYGLTIDRYPESSWAEKALVRQIESYVLYADHSVRSKMDDRYKKAISSYEKYVQLFPNGPNRSRAEELYDRARVGLSEVTEEGQQEDEGPVTENQTGS